MRKTSLAVAVITATALGSALAAPTTSAQEDTYKVYRFGTSTKHTNITFVSEADIENIYGNTNNAGGQTYLSFAEGKGKCSITIPVKDMKTGIDLRDEHMRSDAWLDEAKFPNITFKSSDIKVKDAKKKTWTAKGTLNVHGVDKEREIEVKIVPIPAQLAAKIGTGDWVRVIAKFDVKLGDHDIEIPDPEQVGPKVSETWQVKFDCYGVSRPK